MLTMVFHVKNFIEKKKKKRKETFNTSSDLKSMEKRKANKGTAHLVLQTHQKKKLKKIPTLNKSSELKSGDKHERISISKSWRPVSWCCHQISSNSGGRCEMGCLEASSDWLDVRYCWNLHWSRCPLAHRWVVALWGISEWRVRRTMRWCVLRKGERS